MNHIILIGIVVVAGFVRGTLSGKDTPIISSITCDKDTFNHHAAEESGVHLDISGPKDQLLLDQVIESTPQNGKIAAKDCYIDTGSWKITDFDFVNQGAGETVFTMFKNSKNELRFRIYGDIVNKVSYKLILWGEKGEGFNDKLQASAVCCDVDVQ